MILIYNPPIKFTNNYTHIKRKQVNLGEEKKKMQNPFDCTKDKKIRNIIIFDWDLFVLLKKKKLFLPVFCCVKFSHIVLGYLKMRYNQA